MRFRRHIGTVVVLFFLLVTPTIAAAQARPADAQGKVVAVTGTVQHTVAQREVWNPASVFQPLFAAERVRTLTASKAAILFIDESQVKLNAGAVLTVHAVRRAGGPTTSLELERGEAWFRTKNPASGLTIQTPAAAAAVRGTEIDILVRPDNETVLTVVEGSAEFSNTAGSIMVNAGEEGTARPGQAPTKRVILNPENAVQWALYYPVDRALASLPAAALLEAGDVAGARQSIESALARDARALQPLVLLSTIELTQNHVDQAADAANRALAVDGNFVPALVAASEAEQGRFDLGAARRLLDRALQLDPRPSIVRASASALATRRARGSMRTPPRPWRQTTRKYDRCADSSGSPKATPKVLVRISTSPSRPTRSSASRTSASASCTSAGIASTRACSRC
jgi:hypothetical protein